MYQEIPMNESTQISKQLVVYVLCLQIGSFIVAYVRLFSKH